MNFQEHRSKLATFAGGSPVILTAYDAVQLSGDMATAFLQEACFWWLTGIDEPGWKVVIDTARHHTTLVRPAISDVQRLFGGESASDDIIKRTGADEIIDEREFEQYLRRLARHHTLAYTTYDNTIRHDFVLNPAARLLHEQLTRIFNSVEDCTKSINQLKAVKSEDEIRAIKRAVALTCKAFQQVRDNLSSYTYEYEIEADFWRAFRGVGATHAYEPIVATGAHAVTLHYSRNSGRIASRDAVLIDVGARVDGYCADITRTYAHNPSKRQRQVHTAVENAHRRIIKLLGPDVAVADYVASVDDIMKDALQEVGLLADRSDLQTYRTYFPHAVSHGLGIDVHDSLGAPRYFQPGMIVTVEPGIYIPEEGIGVRIEDDILITTKGALNLSRGLSTSL